MKYSKATTSSLIFSALRREFLLLQRKKSFWIYPACLYCILMTLFPFGLGADPFILKRIAVGVVWVSTLMVVMMTLMTAFTQDYQEGVVESFLFSCLPLTYYGLIKVLAWWLQAILPVILLTPVFLLSYGFTIQEGGWVALSLIPGTLNMSLIVALGGALTLALRENGMVLALLVLPLLIPNLIVGSGLMLKYFALESTGPSFCILIGLLCLECSLCPLGIARALRLSVGR